MALGGLVWSRPHCASHPWPWVRWGPWCFWPAPQARPLGRPVLRAGCRWELRLKTALSVGQTGSVCPPGVACRPAPLFWPGQTPRGAADTLSRRRGDSARQSPVQAVPGDRRRREGLRVSAVQGDSCWGSFSLSQTCTCTSSAFQRVTPAQMPSPLPSEARGHRQPRGLITKDLNSLNPASGRGVKRAGDRSGDRVPRPAASTLTLDPKPSRSLLSCEEP